MQVCFLPCPGRLLEREGGVSKLGMAPPVMGAVKERSRGVPQTSSLSGNACYLGKAARSAGRKEREGLGCRFVDERGDVLRGELQKGGATGYCLMGMRMAHRRLLLPEQITYSPRLHLSVEEGVVRGGTGNDTVCIERSMQRRASEISHMDMDLLNGHEVTDSRWAGIGRDQGNNNMTLASWLAYSTLIQTFPTCFPSAMY